MSAQASRCAAGATVTRGRGVDGRRERPGGACQVHGPVQESQESRPDVPPRLRERIAELEAEVDQLREQLRSQRAEREELLDVVSHELRTPVTVILGFGRLLLSGKVGPLTDDQRRYLTEAHRSCQQLNDFIAGLLQTSQGLSGGLALQARVAPVVGPLETVARMLKPLLEERGQRAEVRAEPGLRARFDERRLEQVLVNLVSNAARHGPEAGTITLRARRRCEAGTDWVELSVHDEGPGVPESERPRVMEPYVRSGDASRSGGLGLGLAISRRLVEAHGGRIRIDRPDAGGCTVSFTLPAPTPDARDERG